MMYRSSELLTYGGTLAEALLADCEWPWEALPRLKNYILELGERLNPDEYQQIAETIWIHRSVKLAASAVLHGPTIIGAGTEIRHAAYLRGSVLIDENCVVGNSCELKNSLLLKQVQIPHFNYAGDSIFGRKSHLGAGAITSNVKSDHGLIAVSDGDERIETGLKKFGAVLGDDVEVGCNTVLNPGAIIGPRSRIYPLSMVRGIVAPDSIYKNGGEIVKIKPQAN